MKKIIKLKIIKNFEVELTYNNNKVIIIDFQTKIDEGGIFKNLSNKTLFSKIFISSNGRYIHWDNEIELCADALWYEATGEHFSVDEKIAS